jgi:hypothetical protein
MATAATRQEENLVQRKSKRADLTPTGLLMEGLYTNNPGSMSEIAMLQQLFGQGFLITGLGWVSGRSIAVSARRLSLQAARLHNLGEKF